MEQTKLKPSGLFADDTIVAVSTPPGIGGIAVIRLSGPDALSIADSVWSGRPLTETPSHTARFGRIHNEQGEAIDEAVAVVFKGPKSFTGDDTVEFNCHGSRWIQREVVNLLIRRGARGADAGEFSKRAFINGRIDLAQAEGIIDLIASTSRAAHRLAISQADGSYSRRLESLRSQLVEFASLLELELDFSEEDVEFADRTRLASLADEILREIDRLTNTYATGKAFKEGIPVVIAGEPNAGKSTLLNALLEEDKAIVSEIPGTTRDIIEDTRELEGILFRFIDTAGLRSTEDIVEQIGINRATDRLRRASIVIWTLDPTADIMSQLSLIRSRIGETMEHTDATHIIAINKIDIEKNPVDLTGIRITDAAEKKTPSEENHAAVKEEKTTVDLDIDNNSHTQDNHEVTGRMEFPENTRIVRISASTGEGLDRLKKELTEIAEGLAQTSDALMVTNARHYESLLRGAESLRRARAQLDTGLSADFIAQDVREALHHLGAITGAITTPTLLHSIFSRFCIGK